MGHGLLLTTPDGWLQYIPHRYLRMQHITPHSPTTRNRGNETSPSYYKRRSPTQRFSHSTNPHTVNPKHKKLSAPMASSSDKGGRHIKAQDRKTPNRSSMPYPILERLKGRLQPPPQISAYIMQHPRLRPYTAACSGRGCKERT
jgi:hypothetical protein